jgi:MerR family transcriptional regulator, light-induced transcriptional regulator
MAAAPDRVLLLSERYLDAQLRGDRRAAVQLLVEEGLACGVSLPDLLLHVITPAQREIGRLWEVNDVSIADEHVATAISQLAMSHIQGRAQPKLRRHELLLIACVEGEWHDMGARVAADVLEHDGFEVRLVGPSVPVDDLRQRIRLECPDIVLLSVTMQVNEPSARHTFARLRTEFPGLPILVGGPGVGQGDEGAQVFCLPALTGAQAAACAEIERLLRE